jgi:uncharacterized membrane protein
MKYIVFLLLRMLYLRHLTKKGNIMDQKLNNQITELTDYIKQLEKRLAALEARQGVPQARQPERTQTVGPQTHTQQQPSVNWKAIELKFGQYTLQIIGIIVVLIGMGFLFKYSIEQGWINPLVRIILGLGVATACVIGAEFLHAKFKQWTLGLSAGGIVLYYLTFSAAYALYHLISSTTALGALVGTTLLAAGLALRYNSELIGIFSVLGGLITPLILYGFKAEPLFLIQYLALLSALFLLLTYTKRWHSISIINFVALLLYTVYLYAGISASSNHTTLFILLILAIYNLIPFGYALIYKPVQSIFESSLMTLSGLYAFGWLFALHPFDANFSLWPLSSLFIGTPYWLMIEYLCIGFGLLYLAELGLLLFRDKKNNYLLGTLLTLVVTCGAGAITSHWSGYTLNVLLHCYALLLLFIGLYNKHEFVRKLSYIMWFCAYSHLVWLYLNIAPTTEFIWSPINIGSSIVILLFIAAIYLFKQFQHALTDYEKQSGQDIAKFCVAFIVFCWGQATIISWFDTPLTTSFERTQKTNLLLTIYYGAYALCLITIGLLKKQVFLRYFGLGLIALTLSKLWYIIMSLPETLHRVIAFILVGICFTLASFVYQKLNKKVD